MTNAMRRRRLVAACGVLMLTGGGALSADYGGTIGESHEPLVDYSVQNKETPDYEPPHNLRVEEPYKALIPTLSADVPMHVRPHSRDVLTDIEDRPFFDYNGWQTFIGLIWPADWSGGGYVRGKPNRNVTPEMFRQMYATGGAKPVAVFETLRTDSALFPDMDGSAAKPDMPPDWFANAYQPPLMLTDMENAEALDEAFSNPLIDQNRKYVRYQVQMNRVFWDYVRHNGYYWKGNLPKSPSPVDIPPLPVPHGWFKDQEDNKTLPRDRPLELVLQKQTNTIAVQRVHGNSITTKTAWRIMITEDDPNKPWQQVDDLSRYYTTRAIVQDPVTGEKEHVTVGLVGLHVVVRTTQFPQGLWSSFGHVDNLPEPGHKFLEDGRRASFNSNGTVFYPNGYSYEPSGTKFPDERDRVPVEVSRIWKIPDTPIGASSGLPYGLSTEDMNLAYRDLLEGTVWEYYQLEITQWPTDPGSFYAPAFLQMRGLNSRVEPDADQPDALQQIWERNNLATSAAYPRWSGLPIPQVGALNPILETYFQNPPNPQPLENASCMGCHYDAADLGYVWSFKLGTQPQPYNQGRIHKLDSELAARPAITGADYSE